MKEKELRGRSTCTLCGQKIGACGVPMFWTLTITRWALNADALRRQQGLGMMLNGALAMVMGTDEDLAAPFTGPLELTVCESCCTERTCVARLAEQAEQSISEEAGA